MEQIKLKILKLLALADSPNEHEAQLALQKAQELMQRHSLEEKDLLMDNDNVAVHETDITFSRRRASWTLQLANVIAEIYHCRAFSRRRNRQQTRTVCLAGFSDDIQICERMLQYALSCINDWIFRLLHLNRDLYSAKERNLLSSSYAKGYIAGIYAAFRRRTQQQDAHGTSLVPRASNAVDLKVESMPVEQVEEEEMIRSIFLIGYSDGLRFHEVNKLESRTKSSPSA